MTIEPSALMNRQHCCYRADKDACCWHWPWCLSGPQGLSLFGQRANDLVCLVLFLRCSFRVPCGAPSVLQCVRFDGSPVLRAFCAWG